MALLRPFCAALVPMVTQLAEILVVLKMNPEITAEQHAAALRILQETTVRKAPARFARRAEAPTPSL